MSGNYSFIPIFHPLLIYRPMQVQILSKLFNSLHKRVLKTVLRKTITLTISDYNFLSILALKARLNYNKGVLIHSIMSRKVSPMATFSLNQSRHSEKLNIPIRMIDHFKSGLEYCGSVLWNSLPNSLRLPSITKMFQSCYRPYVMLCADWLSLHVRFGDCNVSATFYLTVFPVPHAFTHQ